MALREQPLRRPETRTRESSNRSHRLPRYRVPGTALAVLLAASSFTPSLLPRTPVLQGIIAGVAGAFGYGIGQALAWAVRRVTGWRPGRATVRRARLVLAVAGGLLVVLALGFGWRWQRDLHELMGVEAPPAYDSVLILLVALLVFVGLVALGRVLRRLTGWILRHTLGRLPLWLARTVAVTAVTLLVLGIISGVVLRGLLALFDAVYSVKDTRTETGVVQPSAPQRSGSPASLISWSSLGYQGRNFVAKGPDAADISKVTGQPATEPVRVYAGLQSGATVHDRVDVAVRDLQRAGGFDRKALIVVTTTGTGWVDPASVDAAEYILGGDTATAAMQYSYLPSWLSFLVDQSKAKEAGTELFEGVYAAWSQLPADHRPKLYVFGESLGSFGAQSAFPDLPAMRDRTSGAMLVGTPNSTDLWRAIVGDRDAGSPEWLPVYQQGQAARFAAAPPDLAQPPSPWTAPRVAYLQHPSDPIVWWAPALLVRRPDWLSEPRGPDVLPAMHWVPWVTFWQVTADMLYSTGVPDGHGHVYKKECVDAWVAVLQPPGWTVDDTARVRAEIG